MWMEITFFGDLGEGTLNLKLAQPVFSPGSVME
jgi:hypothetical protein